MPWEGVAGSSLNSVPAPAQQTLSSNYIDFTSTATAGWAQQYVPDLMEQEAEVFGNRTVAGFLELVGAEEAMTSDQVIWSEQGRLHLSYQGTSGDTGTTVTLTEDVDGNAVAGASDHGVRVGDLVLVADADATVKCYVSAVAGAVVTVEPYTAATLVAAGIADAGTVSLFVFGSEFAKGVAGRSDANAPQFQSFTNKPIIMKDYYEVSGSDASQIGWVEVTGEDGQTGYLWFLKAAGDTRSRFADYCEMTLVEAETAAAGSAAIGETGITGTEGLFAAVQDRGNITYGDIDLEQFDFMLVEFDKQGAIEENMMFLQRHTALDVDDMLASLNSYGANGTSYGVFDNDEDMALNLGFSGFRRGSYDFYKTDWKYLNDKSTRGGVLDVTAQTDGTGAIRGIVVPAGVSTVYDEMLGKNLKRPFLHVRYRASEMDDRRFKTWTTGSVGARTSDIDAMEMHFLTERCLVVQGANNFMLLRGQADPS